MSRGSYLRAGAALVAIALLGACKGGTKVAMEPGEWETTVTITSASLDNLPPEMRAQMGSTPLNQPQTTRGCMAATADAIRVENLRFTVPDPGMHGAGCQMIDFTMEGGQLSGRLNCTGIPAGPMMTSGQTMTVSGELNGTYSANTAQAEMHGELRVGDRSGSAALRFTSRRVGACPAPRPYTPPIPIPSEVPEMDNVTMDNMTMDTNMAGNAM
jgi:hypothetical protein